MLNLSLPGNPRYQPKDLQPVFGYDNLFQPVAEVEIATMKTLAEIGIIPEADIASLTPAVEHELLSITTTEVDDVERKVTKHDIRAWVRLAQSKVSIGLRRWIHVPLTSYDTLDTARALQFVRGHEVVKQLTNEVIGHFAEQVNLFASQPQIGRTHGQHALPITVGFWFATILNRILTNIQSANSAAGYEGDAHELVNHIAMPHSKQSGVPLLEATQWALRQHPEDAGPMADQVWEKIPPETIQMLSKPETYTGAATTKAFEIAKVAEAYLKTWQLA